MPSQLEEIFWVNLIPEINAGQCILVIGPDLVSFEDNQTLFNILSQQLTDHATFSQYVNKAPHVFDNEELIQPKTQSGDTWLYEFYRDFYQSRTEFDDPFLKIAQLPFHLIISLLPDERLPGVFDQIGRPHQFNYYPCSEDLQKPAEVEKPSKEKPLVYNLLGTVGTVPSPKLECVITFDHLFTYLQGILSDNRSLPLELAKRLLTAKTVLFLGVHFERWYTQVLLRVLLPKTAATSKKYSMMRGDPDSDVSIFMTERLALKFLSIEPVDFLAELYRRFDEKGMLIPVKKKIKATVFVSYSHADNVIVDQLVAKLNQADIAVIRDEESMPVGERISRFMEQVKTVDSLVVIVSERSLQSPFVGKEIQYALDNRIRPIPAYLDKAFLGTDIGQKIHKKNDEQLEIIQNEIAARKNINRLDLAKDLVIEEELRQEFGLNLDRILAVLKDAKEISLQEPDTEAGIQRIIHEILTRH